MTPDELFMQRALELAARGIGSVSPNPRVGCVIVHEHRIIGEGWHQRYGGPHAEVEAVSSVANPSLLADSTAYVNLEPCSHTGKTPPCADLLIAKKLKRVVIANRDSNPLVSGGGIEKLRAAGIDVTEGVLANKGRELNKRFFCQMEQQRPYIVLKWAQTSDRFIAKETYESKWISGEASRQWVHRWRAEEDGILVGSRTASHDNPMLNVRHWSGRNPVRIVIDRFLRLSQSLHLFDRQTQTICYNLLKHEENENLLLVRLDEQNFLSHLLQDLLRQKVQSVLVEGGRETLQAFIDGGWWDEARVFTSPRSFGKGIAAPIIRGKVVSQETIGDDRLDILVP